jgi:hypothetical protein
MAALCPSGSVTNVDPKKCLGTCVEDPNTKRKARRGGGHKQKLGHAPLCVACREPALENVRNSNMFDCDKTCWPQPMRAVVLERLLWQDKHQTRPPSATILNLVVKARVVNHVNASYFKRNTVVQMHGESCLNGRGRCMQAHY